MQSYIYSAFRAIIPKPENQRPLDFSAWPEVPLPFLSLIFMGYLSQRPNTHVLRALIFPIPFFSCLRLAYDFTFRGPEYATYNIIKSFLLLGMAVKAIDFLLFFDSNQKISKQPNGKATPPEGEKGSEYNSIFPTALLEACDASFSLRGIKYHYGQGVYIPKDKRPMQRWPFVWATTRRLISSYLTLDVLDSLWKLLPLFQDPYGRSIYLEQFAQPKKFFISLAIHIYSGYVLREMFLVVYLSCTLFGVAILNNPPQAWPPIFDSPYRSTSLHRFWAAGWHQILRRTFMVCGGLPGEWVGRKLGLRKGLGLLVGTFLGSSLYHEAPFYILNRGGFDWRMPGFFMMHGFFVFVERVWRRTTGRMVGGWNGWVWGCFVTLVLGRSLSDSWHKRGFGGSVIIPPILSPMRRFIIPTIVPWLQILLPQLTMKVSEFVATIK